MTCPAKISGLYAIVDSGFNPLGSAVRLAEELLKGGAGVIQLRDKGADRDGVDLVRDALGIMKLKDRFDFTFIVNDYVDAAIEIGADGVHVGENDEPVESIRARVPAGLLVGYSSHSEDEAIRAEGLGADYVAFGAIFETRTKGPGHPVQGLERLSKVAGAVKVPLVAIGGIDRDNLDSVLGAGADSVAMITALSLAEDVAAETRWFAERISAIRKG